MNDLVYPFAKPEIATPIEVAPGVFWVRLALPFPPEHINVWLIEDGAGYAIVDCGLARDDTKASWEKVFATIGKPITRVICTHFHPDHLGLAHWLIERWRAELWITGGEWHAARAVHALGSPADIAQRVAFYRGNGVGEDAIGPFAQPENLYRRGVPEVPAGFRRITGGVPVRVGSHEWLPIIGRGHAPEHACLWNRALGVLICGDILLPRITPNVSVWPSEPFADPLRDYLASLDGFAHLPDDALVLPAHGLPYRGLHDRLAALKHHHDHGLDALAAFLSPNGTAATDCFSQLFKATIGPHNIGLAVGEALAHLHLLESRGRARRGRIDNVWRFTRV